MAAGIKYLPADFNQPQEWLSFVKKLVRRKGKVLFLGAPDTGKSTLALFLLDQMLKSGKSVAFLNTDLGQTALGLPGMLDLVMFSSTGRKIRHYFYFVGALSPAGFMPEVLAGLHLLLSVWEKHPTEFLLVDTSGFVLGRNAIRLKQAKINLLKPQWVVGLQASEELEPLFQTIQFWRGIQIKRFPISPSVRKRSRDTRQQYRRAKFSRYFRREKEVAIPVGNLVFLDTWLGTGQALSHREIAWLSQKLGTRVLYGETGKTGIFLLTENWPAPEHWLDAARETDTLDFHITPFSEWENLIVGVEDSHALALGLGRITGFDPEKRCVQIRTPIQSFRRACALHWGSVYFDPHASPVDFQKVKSNPKI